MRMLRLLSLLATLSSSACMTLTTAQTANTLKPGTSAGHVGVASTQTQSKVTAGDSSETTKTTQTGLAAGARYGLFQGFEIGARASTQGMAMVDTKLGLVDGAFAVAVGLGQGYFRYDSKTTSEFSASSAPFTTCWYHSG